ncbi:MAG: apolipoprotein N-acyltransferase [Phycisphaerae bacterium]|nr:apolipoprotein N-acyltransferase [Phycisphaerae bacterium]
MRTPSRATEPRCVRNELGFTFRAGVRYTARDLMGKKTKRQAATRKQAPRRDSATKTNSATVGLPGKTGSAAVGSPADLADSVLSGRRFRKPARLVGAQATIQSRMPVLVLTGLSLLMCCLVFPPVDWWWLGYVCLVPWLVCVCAARRTRFVFLVSLLFGLGFFLVHVRWLIAVTWEGYLALCVGFSVFFPLAAWPIRHMYRRHGVSVALTAPIAWVAMEYLRSIGDLGFPFFLLGHSQYKILTMIQISDLVGAYGVSFVLVMLNGWITDLLIQPILIWRTERGTRLPVGSLTTLLVLLGTVIYGSTQRSKASFMPGPRIAIVQHDFPMYVDRRGYDSDTIFGAYLELARKAAAEKPDLILMPETAIACYVNDEFLDASPADLEEIRQQRFPRFPKGSLKAYQSFSRRVRDAFQALSTEFGVPIVLGSSSLEWRPKALPPGVQTFNSAFLLEPGETRPVARYDKVHLVLFGEYVPFRYSYRPLYDWLNSMTPWGGDGVEYSLTPGDSYTVFEFGAVSRDNQRYRAAVPICYEECMPYIARVFTRGGGESGGNKNIDMLLTISNDGWFLHAAELEQHLSTAVFRAVENRIPIARSVNTGASAQIHPNGKIHDLVALSEETGRRLDSVVTAMDRLKVLVDRMEPQVSSEEAYKKTFEEFGRVYLQDLLKALQAAGPEYTYMDERFRPLFRRLTDKRTEFRLGAIREFRERLDDSLETIARWRTKPWTAPGYIIANMQCDSRVTIYTRWGDWFAQGAVALYVLMLVDWLLRRSSRRKPARIRDEE